MNTFRTMLSTQMIETASDRAASLRPSGALTAAISPPKMLIDPMPVQASTMNVLNVPASLLNTNALRKPWFGPAVTSGR
jgi:hypothetical protein